MLAGTDVAVIGAGPYGLSIAAHLRAKGVSHRVFGLPMAFWRDHMPTGMLLKSEGFASSLCDPDGTLTLGRFCEERRIAYADLGLPVSLETFASYGLAFQERLVPELEPRTLVHLERGPSGFVGRLDDGASFTARRVVLATGIDHFRHVPEPLLQLPPELRSHSAEHHDLARFKGRDVTVVGGGASAIDLAALLHEAGARARLVVRRAPLALHGQMQLPRSLWERMRRPLSGIGTGWRLRLLADAPLLFHRLPEAMRLRIVQRALGPAGGWFMKDRIAPVPTILGAGIKGASASASGVELELMTDAGATRRLTTEHVIAATGFRVDVARVPFLSESIRSRLRLADGAPVLSTHFESSVPGLYVVGAAAANSFGPLMRFAAGAEFATQRIVNRLTSVSRARPSSVSKEMQLTGTSV